MYIQVMTFEEAEKFRWNPFDLTKVTLQFKRMLATSSLLLYNISLKFRRGFRHLEVRGGAKL